MGCRSISERLILPSYGGGVRIDPATSGRLALAGLVATSIAQAAGVDHGSQITTANTGYQAYTDPSLGHTLTEADLTTSAATRASDLITAGGTLRAHKLTSDTFDIDVDCTLEGCLLLGSLHSTTGATYTANYCTADCSAATSWQSTDNSLWGGQWTAYRCQLVGASDGIRGTGGTQTATECYIRCTCRAADAHADGYQFYNPSASTSDVCTIERCNIDATPTTGVGNANAALFAADSTTMGSFYWRDNLLRGGAIVVRCNDSGTYHVTGNRIVDDGNAAAGTFGAAVIAEWSGNISVDTSGNTLGTVSSP